MAPAFMAWTDIGMSAAPVRKTIGRERPACASLRCSASPSSPGINRAPGIPVPMQRGLCEKVLCRFEDGRLEPVRAEAAARGP